MAPRVQCFDWSATPLGSSARWSAPLKTLSGVVLASVQPMFLAWWPDGIWIYNDALIPLLGDRHPSALGQPALEVWTEMRDELSPVFDRALAGESVQVTALTMMMHGDGMAPRPAHFTLSCTPIRDDTGSVVGVLGTCFEVPAGARPEEDGSGTQAVVSPDAMLESEQRFLEIADAAPVLMWRSDPNGIGVWFNKAWLSMTGRSLAQESGDRWVESVHPDDLPRRLALIHRAVETREPFRIDYRLLRHDGEWCIVDETAVPRFARNERFLGFVGCCVDVTDRRATELALRQSEEQLRLATEAAEIGLWDVDFIAGTLYWPPRMKAMFGISPDRPVSLQDFYDGLHPEDRFFVSEAFAAASDPNRRAPYDVEYRAVGKEDGVIRWIAAKGRGIFDESGRCIRVIGTGIDITARKQIEDQLRQLAGTLEQRVEERTAERDRVWRNSRGLLVVLGIDGILRAVNPAWTRVLGHSPEEVVGRSVLDYLWPEDADAGLWQSRGTEGSNFETRFRHKDGSQRSIFWHISVESDLVFAYGRDNTAERDQQEALRVAEEQLRQAQKMEAVGQLTGGLAHDFNNLLTGIAGSLELLKGRLAQGRTAELDRYITAAQGATRRAAVLTHRLLAFSRRQTLDPKPVQANRLVAEMEELIRRTIGPSISLVVHGAEDLWTTFADPNQLENAVLNLCINARDAMPDGGELTIGTQNLRLEGRAAQALTLDPGQYVAISVTDTGVGMPPDVIDRAFDPFYTTKPIGMGTGLGLSMIYGFAKQSGGQVRIKSEVARGTRVCIYLPRYLGDLVSEEAPHQSGEAPRAREGETVLVVDDEPTVRMLITDILEDLGYRALEAGDGTAALEVLQSDRRIDLLVTDVGLPGGMNGRQVADAGRALRPELRVLFITGYAESSVLPAGSLARGMQVLTKPFRVDELADRIKGLIQAD